MATATMNATLIETADGMTVVDEYGDTWDVFTGDGSGNYAIERDGGERWHAGTFIHGRGEFGPLDSGEGTLYEFEEGQTFGVNCQDEFIVKRMDNAGSLRWAEND